MCGIAGKLSFGPDGVRWPDLADSWLSLMARRGPDQEGRWTDGYHCGLAFRRLSILDLSAAGNQPMITHDGRYVIVYNGELYNFRELRRVLEAEGVRFLSSGDTEVVLYALVHWGIAALNRFNGMFALGFYDTKEKRLLLARDHVGIKPLYYMQTQQGLVFASQYDQILAHPWSQTLSVDANAMALYLRLGYIPAPHATLESTHMLEPGTWLEVTVEGHTRRGRFFEFPASYESDLQGEEAYEAVDAAITAAVRRQMLSDVPLGTFLSGGIDSPLVTAKASAVSTGPLKAFTIGTNGDSFDESPDAMIYARELGVEHVVEQVSHDQLPAMLDEAVMACQEPFADYSILPTILVSRLARRQVKVILAGDGGDELFWGYDGRFGSVVERSQDFRTPSWLRGTRWFAKRALNIGGGHRNLLWPSIGHWYRAKHTRIPEYWIQRIFPELPGWPKDFELFSFTGSDATATAQWLRWNEFVGHLTMVLQKVDRASMYHSLEVRVPLLDREVVEIAARVDWRSCLDVRRQIGKLPLRKALSLHLQHQTKTKRGFGVPMNAWMRGPLRPLFEEMVLGRQTILGITINRNALREMFTQHLEEQIDHSWGLWVLLSLTLWEDRHYRARRNPVSTLEMAAVSAA